MRNLAGEADCDQEIRRELQRSRIPLASTELTRSEVPYTVYGRLGAFEFRRAWYYWCVDGPVPVGVAVELYADPVGKADVRVAGHCGCPPPEDPWVHHYDAAGKKIELDPGGRERKTYKGLIARGHLEQAGYDAVHWVDSVEERAAVSVRAVVDSYHIDTEVGLRLFVDTLRRHKLVPENP